MQNAETKQIQAGEVKIGMCVLLRGRPCKIS